MSLHVTDSHAMAHWLAEMASFYRKIWDINLPEEEAFYKVLIKCRTCSNKDLFKFYQDFLQKMGGDAKLKGFYKREKTRVFN